MPAFTIIKDSVNKFYLIKSPNYTLVSISLCKFLYGFYTAAIGSLLVPIGATFDIDTGIQSIVFPFNYFGQIVIIFFIGYFADKLGKKLVHTTSLILLAVFTLLFNYVSSFYLFLILFFFMGLFGISINTIADATVSDTFEKKKGFYLNIAHVFFGLGALTSPIVFNLVFAATGDFRTVYFILFIISFIILVLIAIAKYPTVEDEPIRPSVILDLLKNRKFLYLCIFALLSAGAMHSVSGWIPTLFQKNLNVSAEISNYSLSFFWMSIVIGRIITAFLSRKYSEALLLRTLNIMIFFVLAATFFLNDYIILLAAYLLFGLLLGGTFPLVIAYSAEIYPRYSTTRLATVFSFTAMGMLLIPTIVGVLGRYFLIYKIIAFTSIVFLIYIFVFYKKLR
jgi:FHS family glucose/mannose:H+ symporter-like MFS transporter